MRYSFGGSATILALFLTVYALPSGNPIVDGYQGSITNAKQTQDTLNRQLQSGDGHPTADMLSAFITGADSQIDNAAASIASALSPLTGGLSEAIGGVLLGPFFQSATNGAEVLLSNLVAAPIDEMIGPMLQSYTKNLSRVSAIAKETKIDSSKLDSLISQLNAKVSAAGHPANHNKAKGHKSNGNHKRANPADAVSDGIQGSVTNARQTMDTLSRQLQRNDGHPTADMISAFITGADSQIDNAAASIASALSPLTGGLSEAVGGFLLGPFVQASTNGAEVLLSNLIGMPIDAVIGPMVGQFSQSLSRVSALAKESKIDTGKLDQLISQLDVKAGPHAKSKAASYSHGHGEHHKRDIPVIGPILSGFEGAGTALMQSFDMLTNQLKSNDGHPTSDTISAFITGADAQIDNAAAAVSGALGPLTFGLSNQVGGFLLGPFFQSVTNGGEVLLSNLIGSPLDDVMGPLVGMFTTSMGKSIDLGKKFNVDTSKMEAVSKKLSALPRAKGKSANKGAHPSHGAHGNKKN